MGEPRWLLVALTVASAYAALATGATGLAQAARLEVGLAVLALAAVASWAWGGGVRWQTGRTATAGLIGLACFAGWEGATLAWSVAPDATWTACNQSIAFVLVVGLALAAGASVGRAADRAAVVVLASCALVALDAFGALVLPGLRLGGLLDLDRPGAATSLQAPLGDPRSLALVCVLGLPLAVRLATGAARRTGTRTRGLALAAGLLLVCVGALADPRGGAIALAVAVAVLAALGPGRVRDGLTFAGLGIAATPVLLVARGLDGTSRAGVPLAERSADGSVLLATFAGCLAALLAGAWASRRLAPRVVAGGGRARAAAVAIVVLALAGGIVALAGSERGLGGTVAEQAGVFAGTREAAGAERRRDRWQEAAGAWSERPALGWGAGATPVLHLRHRTSPAPVSEAQAGPMQVLAETGLVGLVLLVAALGLLGAAALARMRASTGGERELAVAGLAAVAGWAVHCLFDRDWSVPGTTVPALVLLGVLAAGGGSARATRRGGPAALVVAAAALVLGLVAVSAILPAWADRKAAGAQRAVTARATDAELRDAAARAEVAARLDPLAVRPLLASAAIARRRGRLLEARDAALRAVDRQPQSPAAWLALAGASADLADRPGAEQAALRALALDPLGARTRDAAADALAQRTPPGASATAVGTPLAPAPVPAP